MASNRFGKTQCGAAEMAIHLTGRYPDWWQGKRFDKPVRAWAAGVTTETTRDVVQDKLIGPPDRKEDWGTGFIPKDALGEPTPARGIANAIDTVSVKHVSGGFSTLQFKSYERGREKWQGTALEVVWMDEECPANLYFEALTRTNETGGVVYITFTPLQGVSDVVHRFMQNETPGTALITATIDDALHFTPEQREQVIASYPAHERDARVRGIPSMGSGRIFPVSEELIAVDPLPIPDHWAQINGLDFGWDHPFAAVNLAWDRDADCVYVCKTYRQKEATPAIHAAAVRPWGKWIPNAWPHDGYQHDKTSGMQLKAQYEAHDLNMLFEHSTHPEGGFGTEAGIMMMLERMQTGRFKVFANLSEWFEEFRLYHRQNGKIVKERDDLMSATRMGVMMLRYATTQHPVTPPPSRYEKRRVRGSAWAA